jgi:hypothetical protein
LGYEWEINRLVEVRDIEIKSFFYVWVFHLGYGKEHGAHIGARGSTSGGSRI